MICALCAMPRMRVKACIAAMPSVLRSQLEEWSYKAYVTDTLRQIAENTAVPAAAFTDSKAGQYPALRWMDVLHPQPEETRTPEEIIAGIRESLKD